MMLININIAWPKKRREIRDRQADTNKKAADRNLRDSRSSRRLQFLDKSFNRVSFVFLLPFHRESFYVTGTHLLDDGTVNPKALSS